MTGGCRRRLDAADQVRQLLPGLGILLRHRLRAAMKERDLGLEEILAAAREPDEEPGARHSPLYEWFWARHPKLAPKLNPPCTPNWRKMAARFDAMGFKNGRGGALNAVTVRQTWAKVERDKEITAQGFFRRRRGRKLSRSVAPSPAPSSAQAAAQGLGSGFPPDGGGDPDEPPPRTKKFNLATRK